MKTRSLAPVKPKMKRQRKSAFPKKAALPSKKAAPAKAVKAATKPKADKGEKKLDAVPKAIDKKGLCCSNCNCKQTPLWRMIDNKTVCNACGLRYTRHGTFDNRKTRKAGPSKTKRDAKKAKVKPKDQVILPTSSAAGQDDAKSNLSLDVVHSKEYILGPCDTKSLLRDLREINDSLAVSADDTRAEFAKALAEPNLQKEEVLKASDLGNNTYGILMHGAAGAAVANPIRKTGEEMRFAMSPAIGRTTSGKKPVSHYGGNGYYDSESESESGSCETISPEKMRIACYPRRLAESQKVVSFFKSSVPLLGYSGPVTFGNPMSQAATATSSLAPSNKLNKGEKNQIHAAAGGSFNNPTPFCKRIQRAALKEELKSVQLAIKRIDAEIQRRKRSYEETFAGVLFERLHNFSPSGEQGCPPVEGTFNADLRTLLKNFSFPCEERGNAHAMWDKESHNQMPQAQAGFSLFTQFFESSKTVHFDSPLLAKETMISYNTTTQAKGAAVENIKDFKTMTPSKTLAIK